MLRERNRGMLLLSCCILCIVFSNYKVSWFLICHWLLTFQVKRKKKFKKIWKLLVHHWKSSKIATFMEHPVYIIFKEENVLNLAFWFSFDTSCPNSKYKIYLFLNFGCSAKVASIFLFLWNNLYSIFNVQNSWLTILLCH